MKKTIILFEFDEAYTSTEMDYFMKYKSVRYAGERFQISLKTIDYFDDLVEQVFKRSDTMAISFVTMSERAIADKIFNEVTSLESVHLPEICITSEEMKDETLKRLALNVDRVIWVGPNAPTNHSYNCELRAIPTLHEMTQQSWITLIAAALY